MHADLRESVSQRSPLRPVLDPRGAAQTLFTSFTSIVRPPTMALAIQLYWALGDLLAVYTPIQPFHPGRTTKIS